MNDFFYKVNDTEYPVHIVHKRIKNIHYRFIDGSFVISCHPLTTKKYLQKGLDRFAESLVERGTKEKAWTNDYIYLYGIKVPLKDSGTIKFSNGEEISYKNKEDLTKKLKKQFLEVLKSRVQYYCGLMNVPLYKISIRNMRTRYGSNSKRTKSINFAFILLHYSHEIIDSVIVHELAHILVFDHSQKFYNVVYKYCPNYKDLRKKLIRGEFK